MKNLILILGDQLFDGLPGMPPDAEIFMKEDWGLATRHRHHKQKLVLFFSAMRHFALARPNVHYEPLNLEDRTPFLDCLTKHFEDGEFTQIWAYEPADEFFKTEVEKLDLPVKWVPNPMFLTSREDWDTYAGSTSRRLMADFYVHQRKRLNILLTPDRNPVGGKWSFDAENRKPLPKSVRPPFVLGPAPDSVTREVMDLVSREFADHPGSLESFEYPVTRNAALEWLEVFIEERLGLFGDYEDAIPQSERVLFHSVLTPMLNIGLLTPAEVVEAAACSSATLNSKEGFIRQVIGWREFIFWQSRESDFTTANQFGFKKKLAPCWWDGTTGLPPVDLAIRRAVKHGWTHHIERLMVLGSVMLMCEVDPDEVYRWFMEMFVDSADWVMAPNVYGMSQFAAQSSFATKPYISGSAYILKMSDWKRGEWCDVWDGLYWSFISRHREMFAQNHRMSMVVKSVDRLEPARKQKIFRLADEFRSRVTV